MKTTARKFRSCESQTVEVNPKLSKGEPVLLSEVLPDVLKNIEKRILQNKKGASQ